MDALRERNVAHRVAKTWTTSAPFRETSRMVAKRQDEGCHTVDMEADVLIAVEAPPSGKSSSEAMTSTAHSGTTVIGKTGAELERTSSG